MSAPSSKQPYAAAGVDTEAGDLAVTLMKQAVARTHGPEVVGGVGGFAGLFDASALAGYRHPYLASSTDGVGTKVAIAQALDKHDTIGQDLVGMVVDDIVVVGAKPLFMTDYIACGKVVPERIAAIVAGIARACEATGTALVGGETAEHPGLLPEDEYDVAGAAVGVVEKDALLGPDRVRDGDVVLALESSGLHANGFSLVRHVLAQRGIGYGDSLDEFGGVVGEALLEPTRLYTAPLLEVFERMPGTVHSVSHVTGGGLAANVGRVLPAGAWTELERSSWSPAPVFRTLAELGGFSLAEAEGTWNLGVGMVLVVDPARAHEIASAVESSGIRAWRLGEVSTSARDLENFVTGAKGVDGGAVRLVGAFAG